MRTIIAISFVNLGAIHIEGIDVDATYRWPRMSWGRVRTSISGTYYKRWDAQQTDGTFVGFVAHSLGSPVTGALPRRKHYATLALDTGPWSFTLANTYQSSYVDVNTDLDGNERRVGSMTLRDVQAENRVWKNLTLTLGAKNVLDTNPPQTNQRISFQSGYDPQYYDARERFEYGMARYEFK